MPWAKEDCVLCEESCSKEYEPSQEQESINTISIEHSYGSGGHCDKPGGRSITAKDDPGKDNLLCFSYLFSSKGDCSFTFSLVNVKTTCPGVIQFNGSDSIEHDNIACSYVYGEYL